MPAALPRLDLSNLRGDLFGGMTAAVVALPLALAFGVASGAGPVAGLYGAICVGLFASLFGGTPAQVSGPTGPMTVVAATIFTAHAGNPAIAFTIVMLAGLLQVLFGKLRLGRYINLVPYPVISGFMSGIGVIIIVMQLDPLLGHQAPASVVNALTVLPEYLRHPNPGALVAGGLALAICLFMPKPVTQKGAGDAGRAGRRHPAGHFLLPGRAGAGSDSLGAAHPHCPGAGPAAAPGSHPAGAGAGRARLPRQPADLADRRQRHPHVPRLGPRTGGTGNRQRRRRPAGRHSRRGGHHSHPGQHPLGRTDPAVRHVPRARAAGLRPRSRVTCRVRASRRPRGHPHQGRDSTSSTGPT